MRACWLCWTGCLWRWNSPTVTTGTCSVTGSTRESLYRRRFLNCDLSDRLGDDRHIRSRGRSLVSRRAWIAKRTQCCRVCTTSPGPWHRPIGRCPRFSGDLLLVIPYEIQYARLGFRESQCGYRTVPPRYVNVPRGLPGVRDRRLIGWCRPVWLRSSVPSGVPIEERKQLATVPAREEGCAVQASEKGG